LNDGVGANLGKRGRVLSKVSLGEDCVRFIWSFLGVSAKRLVDKMFSRQFFDDTMEIKKILILTEDREGQCFYDRCSYDVLIKR
jgi:hypothetical protein